MRRERRAGSTIRGVLGALALVMVPAVSGAATGADTTGLHFEIGLGTDFTNEQFYEDAFVDTISLGRRLVSDPETRAAAVMRAVLDGSRAGRTTTYQLTNDLSLGDKIQRGALALAWRSTPSADWRISATPRVEFRKDRTFDRDLEEWRGSALLSVRRDDLVAPAVDFGVGGDFLRTRGEGADFLLDRNALRAFAGVGTMPLLGPEWHLGYSLYARAFPDSSERDHFEHRADGRLRLASGAMSVGFEADASRRVTRHPAPAMQPDTLGSRDDFWEGLAAVETEWRPLAGPSWQLRAEGETIRYDVEDATVYFDYWIGRARLAARFVRSAWTVGVGPRAEVLRSPINPSESYDETGGFIDIEYLGTGFWTVAPAAGWRDYRLDIQPDPFAITAIHSSYAFYEITVIGDQPIAGALRLHLFATGRYESHTDSSQDARSLYFSFDLRKLF